MTKPKKRRSGPPTTTFPVSGTVPKRWAQLRDEFSADLRRAPSGRFCHSLQIYPPSRYDEDVSNWSHLLQFCVGESPEQLKWCNSIPRSGAKLGVRHCWFGWYDQVTLRLIHAAHDLVRTDPYLAGCRTDNFLLLLYLLAWDRPNAVSYCVDQRFFNADDRPTRVRPFEGLEAFEKWETGELHLPIRRFFLWLNRDVRQCAISATNALFLGSGTDSADEPLVKRLILEVDVSLLRLKLDGASHDIEPHEAQMLIALIDASHTGEFWVTGPRMNEFHHCHGKKISREIARLETKVPALKTVIIHGKAKGYRLRTAPALQAGDQNS